MATFAWTLQGTTDTTIDPTDIVQFAGAGGFNTNVTVSQYQDTMHVKSSGGSDNSAGNGPKNSKYISATQVDLGAGTVNLSTMSTGDAPIKVNFSDAASVSTSGAIFYAYDGTTTTTGPTGVTFQAAEQGDTNWTGAEGSGSAVSLTDQAASTSHDFFLAVSASPDSVGLKNNFSLRIELTFA